MLTITENYVVAIISLDNLIIPERQRKEYRNVKELAEDIRANGLINPIACRSTTDGGFQLVCGGRRTQALKLLGVKEVPAHIYSHDTPDIQIEAIELSENIQREPLTWAEEVAAKKRIHDLMVSLKGVKTSTSPDAPGHSMRDTAKMMDISIGSVVDDINLAKSIEQLPMLAECKTKNEARKMLEAMLKSSKVKQIAAKLEASGGSIDQRKKNLINSFIVGDFFDGVKDIPDNTFNIIECDPPYGVEYDKEQRAADNRAVTTMTYTEIPTSEYEAFISRLIKECKRLLKSDGWLIFWYADDPWGQMVLNYLRDYGFKVPAHHPIWYKGKGRGVLLSADYRLASDYASFYYARTDGVINKKGHGLVFEHPPVFSGNKYHPMERPVALMQEILDTFGIVGNRVLVPFAGSGCTLLAAANLKMNPLGFDLSAEYKANFAVRVEEGTYGEYK